MIAMQVRVIDSPEELSEIRSSWDTLLEAAEAASVFMSWEWNHNWWKYYGRNHGMRIITVWEQGHLKAVLPLYLQVSKLLRFWNLTCVRLIGTGGDTSPDYLGPILDRATSTHTIELLLTYLFDQIPEWNVLLLSDLDRNTDFYRELARQCDMRGYRRTESVSASIAFAPLPATWDEYLASVNGDRRNTIRRTRRKIESGHQGRFYAVTDEDQLDGVLASLIELHHQRWQGHPDGHAFSTPEYVAFHRDVIHDCARRGWIRFYCLEANGTRIAVFYCYRFRNQIFYFQAGFNPDHERLRPGLVLIGYAIEHAIEEGNTVFDFLRGDHAYKTQWGKSQRETYTLAAFRQDLPATLYRLQSEWIPALKYRVKKMLPFLDRKPNPHGRPPVEQQGA
jgi:CelD/BcsL family acetyltransferase involved in cellulose biosynthesis